MTDAALLAIDWGTTNRRIYVIDAAGIVLARERDDYGILTMAGGDFAGEVAAIRARHGDLPMVCIGMIGSNRGWAAAPYVACPVGVPLLARALHWMEPERTAIMPGVSIIANGRGDVMRGEETQVLGAVAARLAPGDSMFCQPGTHCKWVQAADGTIVDFRTTMTGELFALLRQHSLLAESIGGTVADGPAFRAGVRDAAEARLLGDLFGVRASHLLALRPTEDAASYASGLLIGSDVREQSLGAGEIVYLLANGDLAALYTTAIEVSGARVAIIDSERAFVAGVMAIWSYAHAS